MSARRSGWRHLVPGILTATAIVLAALAVLVFARVGALHGKKYHLHLLTGEARGILEGSEVWLAGQKVGLVSRVNFTSAQSDTLHRLDIDLEVLTDYAPYFRRDSYAQIRSGGSFIGTPVVYVTVGSARAAILHDGDTLTSRGQLDPEEFTSQIALASRQFPQIIENVKLMTKEMRGVQVAVTGGDDGRLSLGTVGGRAVHFGQRAMAGSGTVGLAMRQDSPIIGRAQRAMARADTILRMFDAPRTSLGRFRSDSALVRAVGDVRDEVSIVRALLAEPRGTAGRVQQDSAIVLQLQHFERELSALMADIKRDPARYIAF